MSDDKPRTYAQIMESCKRARERIERPDIRSEIAAAMREDCNTLGSTMPAQAVYSALLEWADRIESWPLPAGTPDVAGALALLRSIEADSHHDPFDARLVRAIALLEGKGT